MSLPHALLTSLLEKPSSGLELAHRFSKSIGYFWQASHQQIYRELVRLEEAGWVQSSADEGARGRKRTYEVLPAGKAELKRWMALPSEHKNLRDEMMVRIRAAAVVGPDGLADGLKQRLASHREQLALYRAIHKKDFEGKKETRAMVLQRRILEVGIEYERQYVAFCEDVLKELGEA
ncbi:MAG: PadR family transcriptional regulator [Limnobacter sp.]|uniref:PadR family transcriptional regulator n=1 Tax=Limnobacter sp. TaxID=2003368 RepID=UPI003919A16A